MPLTIDEIIAQGSAVGVFVARVRQEVENLPPVVPGEFPAVAPYTDLVGRLLPDLGKLIDAIRADVAD